MRRTLQVCVASFLLSQNNAYKAGCMRYLKTIKNPEKWHFQTIIGLLENQGYSFSCRKITAIMI